MSRYFMLQTWVGSHENEPDYNGQQCGERNVRSSEVVPLYDQYGNANVSAFSDEAIAARSAKAKPASKVSIKHKILPQAARVERLTQQMRDLVASYKAGEMDINEYSLLLDIVSAKKDRAEVLLNKALAQKPIREDDEQPVKAAPKTTPTPSPTPTSPIKQHITPLWTEAKVFLVGSLAACAGLMWLAN